MFLASLVSGILAGAVILFLAHLAPFFGAGNFVRDLDNPHLFGKKVTSREAHLVGALTHLIISGLFGFLFAILVDRNLVTGYTFVAILAWSAVLSLFNGGVILPLEGHGLFGIKEDAWFPVDLFLTSFAWGILFWFTMHLWLNAL